MSQVSQGGWTMAELSLSYGLTIWQLLARYIGGLDGHFTTPYLHSQSCNLVTMHVSSGINDSTSPLRFKTNRAFIGCFADPSQSLVWQGNETSWPVAANRLIGTPLLIFPLNFWVMQSSPTLNHSSEHKLEIRRSLFKSSSQTLINQAGHAVILSLLTL